MKYYVIFKGRNPGIYESWDEARAQIENFPDAIYKGYDSSAAATEAYRKMSLADDSRELRRLLFANAPAPVKKERDKFPPEVDMDAWAVDASCLGNPGVMEYRCVELKTGKEIFKVGPFKNGTNNIGEFLAIVHAMALMMKRGEIHNIYSDSKTGMSWVRNRMVKTQLQPNADNQKVFELMARGVAWLQTHNFPGRVMKWETERWGEIPADFGRKS